MANSPDALGTTAQYAGTGAMIGGPWGAGIGAALGLGKNYLIDQPAYRKKIALEANTERYSPWTGLHGQAPVQPSAFDSAVGGAEGGLNLLQNLKNQEKYNQYLDRMGQAQEVAAPPLAMPQPVQGLGSNLNYAPDPAIWGAMRRY